MTDSNSYSMNEKIHAFLKVSRADLLLASFGHATLGMILGATFLFDLVQLNVLLYIFLHYSIAFFACNINSYFDYHVDRHYKIYLSKSVDIVGKKWLKMFILIEFFIAIVLAFWFFIEGFFIITVLSLLGLVAGFSYSAEPIRFKRRGIFSPLLILFLYSLPILGGWFLFHDQITNIFLLFLVGYIMMNEGYTLINMCEDYEEDKKEGIKTWAHRLGIRTTVKIAVVFSVLGLFSPIALLLILTDFSMSFLYGLTVIMILLTMGLIIKASFEVAEILSFNDLKKATKQYGIRLQRWFLMTRYPLIICALLILACR